MNTTTAHQPLVVDEPAGPVPRRFWWLKRLGIAAAVLLVALLGVRLWWGSIASARLQAEVDRIKAAGEPLFPEDFQVAPIPDEDNAAYFLRQALAQWNEANKDDDAQYLADNAAALALIERARQCGGVDWGIQIASPMLVTLLPHLADMRHLARNLQDVARRQVRLGQYDQALAIVENLFAIADSVDTGPSCLIENLVAISLRGMGVAMLQELLPEIAIASATPADEVIGGASREQFNRIITMLLDDSRQQAGAINGWIGERAMCHDIGTLIASGKLDLNTLSGTGGPSFASRMTAALVGPMFRLDTIRMMDNCTRRIDALRLKTTVPATRQYLADRAPYDPDGITLPRLLSSLLLPALDAAWRSYYQLLTQKRMAAIALAMRLYETDFDHRPATLEELSPTYLAALPIDPMAADGRTFGYKPEGVDPLLPWKADDGSELRLNRAVAILYSVGDDAADNGGAFTLDDDGGAGNYGDTSKDVVFLLDGLVALPEAPKQANPPGWMPGWPSAGNELSDETGVDDPEPETDAGDEQ